jgi:hypothetical protein
LLESALGATVAKDPKRMAITAEPLPDGGVRFSLVGSASPADLENHALQIVSHVAHLRDHLRRWARQHGKDPAEVEAVVRGSDAIKLLIDLSEHEKHGGTRRDGGLSGKQPRLREVGRALYFAGPGQVSVGHDESGKPTLALAGQTAIVTTGLLVDESGEVIDVLHNVLFRALADFEPLVARWRLMPQPATKEP